MIAYVRDHDYVRTGYSHYYFFFLCPLWVFVRTHILPSTNRRVVQPVTGRDQPITAVIKLLFKSGRITDLSRDA